MRAHLVQMDVAWEDPRANRARAEALVDGAGVSAGDLVVLPEMFETGFSMNIERTADERGEGAAWLGAMAKRLRVTLVAGITVRRADGWGLNRALVLSGSGGESARYDKAHPFSFGREAERFKGGDRVVVCAWESGGNRAMLCPVVCYDLRFPELFRAGRMRGAEVFVVIANWPSVRVEHWLALLRARAIENQAVVLGVNRTGSDPLLAYPGASVAFDAMGERIGWGGEAEGVVSVGVDIGACRAWRDSFPAWNDARESLLPRLGADGAL